MSELYYHKARNTRRLFSTTSLIALALAAAPLVAHAAGKLPPPTPPTPPSSSTPPADSSSIGPNTNFSQFTPPKSNDSGIFRLTGDGSTLLINTRNSDTGEVQVYRWQGSAGSYVAGTTGFVGKDINADGSVLIGSIRDSQAAYRIVNGTIENLGTLGGNVAEAISVSDDGNAVAGWSRDASNHTRAFFWSTTLGGMVDIGALRSNQFDTTSANAISGDGTTVVGESANNAFRWQVGGQMSSLGKLSDSNATTAYAVSSDGSVIAGQSFGSARKVFRWTDAGGMQDIGGLPLSSFQVSQDVNFAAMTRDGSTIIGATTSSSGTAAYRWRAGNDGMTGTMQNLGSLGGSEAEALAVNADGSVVVGSAENTAGRGHGFRWTDASGMLTVEDWLRANGATIQENTTATASAVSNDGNTVAGRNANGQFYYARVSALGTGIITPEQFMPTIQSAAATPGTTQLGSANTAMFGAQGSPMRNLLNAGQRSAWGTVDSGYDKSDASDGGFGLGEIGMGYGIADGVTGRFAIGGTYTNQDLEGGGDFNFKGFYLSPEVTANVASNLYVTLGGYYAGGKMDMHRGYMNGGAQDFSNGNTDTQTFGGKLRFDWLDAVTIADTAISPYIGLSRANSKVDAYTESGGSFPVAYGDMSDHATIARLGADYVHPLTDSITLLARTEVAHRFEDKSSSTSANILGLSSVDLPGQDLKQWWVRGGLGAEFEVGGGTASLMVNASTEGGDPTVWLRSGWKVKF